MYGVGCVGVDGMLLSLKTVADVVSIIRVRLQAQAMSAVHQRKYTGALNCIVTILREEKLRGLYKGMASPIVGVAAINSLLFGVHGWFMHHIAGDNEPSVSNIFWAGCGSGFVNAFLSCPMELIKIRLQNQTSNVCPSTSLTSYSGNLDCIKKLYKQGGISSFYRGLHVTIWRETPSYGAYFAAYEVFSHLFTPPGQSLDVPTPGILLAGGLAGIVGWLSTYPFDVIKTHIQSDLSGRRIGMVEAARTIYKAEGIRPFFTGLGATAVRAFPTNAATFYAVCYMRNVLDKK
ncbi:hypothetical protein HDU79_000652 [Rhizoclosmatium sp. JEL0117]|nr:hypothetical protein HDU79_000652 [Rhizoclosmatium sp. JEL0117]